MPQIPEDRLRDVLVAERIGHGKIREILGDAFAVAENDITVVSFDQLADLPEKIAYKACLCITHDLRGDISLMLSLSGYPVDNDTAVKNCFTAS